MQIHGFNKTTLLDFPGHVAATIFTGSCNFRCPFCHNGDLVLHPESIPAISEEEVFSVLSKRKGILTGVCITGGEPTLQKDLPLFLSRLKELGYLVKLDTNGYCPKTLSALISSRLVDYIAMDIKSGIDGYSKVTAVQNFCFENISESVSLIMQSSIDYEFRTTVVRELHSMQDFLQIASLISGCKNYYLQSYTESEQVLQPGFHSYNKEELLAFAEALQPYVTHVSLRGVD